MKAMMLLLALSAFAAFSAQATPVLDGETGKITWPDSTDRNAGEGGA